MDQDQFSDTRGPGIRKAVILAGGRGTRLPHAARGIPKALVEVAGKPILAHQIERLRAAGFRDIRLALCFRAAQIIAFVRERGYGCEWVVEPEALGTGGAVRFASRDLAGPFLVLNGDTIADFDFAAIGASHEPGWAILVSHWREDARDFGLLRIEDGFVRAFLEKPREPTAGHINAGCYVLHRDDLAHLPDGLAMLETDVFPKLAAEGRLKAHHHPGFFEDLGTEARLARVRAAPPPFLRVRHEHRAYP